MHENLHISENSRTFAPEKQENTPVLGLLVVYIAEWSSW